MINFVNDYVECFVEDVNVVKVYIVESVMNCVEFIIVDWGLCVVFKIM